MTAILQRNFHRRLLVADFYERSVIVHEQLRGKIGIVNKIPIESQDDLSTAYTPGVARPCEMIAADPARARDLTIKRNTVAVVSDGSAVLGLGNIGALAALPVMEGKALLFKEYANIDAWPLCLDTQDSDEIVSTVRRIAPVFGGVTWRILPRRGVLRWRIGYKIWAFPYSTTTNTALL